VGESVYNRAVVRSEGGGSSVLALNDGTNLEMNSRSEFSFGPTEDGLRLDVRKGSLIINAFKQTGRLSVKTTDFLLASVGTVFLVGVEEEGSRVAVLKGQLA